MPIDSSGNFTRSYNWVDDRNAGIKIEAVRMDDEFNNYAAAINTTFYRSGLVPMTGTLYMGGHVIANLGGGTLQAPALHFIHDTNTGLASLAVGQVSLVSVGKEILRSTVDGVAVEGDFGVTGDIISGGNMNINGGIAVAQLVVNGPPGTHREIYFQSNQVNRWGLFASLGAETGANAGSDFDISRFADDGTFIELSLSINRITGMFTFGLGGLYVKGGGAQVNGSITSIGGSFYISGASGTARSISMQTAGSSRWVMGTSSTAEGGTNSGSNFYIERYTDAGAYVDRPLTIDRAGGIVTMPKGIVGSSGIDTTTIDAQGYGVRIRQGTAGYAILQFTSASGITQRGTIQCGNDGITQISSGVRVNGAPATTRSFDFATNGSTRWHLQCDLTAEGGGNTGSNFYIQRAGDNGVLIDAPIVINRATGLVTISAGGNSGLAVNGSITSTGGLIIANGAKATWRGFDVMTNNVQRWHMGTSTVDETGSNAGSNFMIGRYADNGSFLDEPLSINRSTGLVTILNAYVSGSIGAANMQVNNNAGITRTIDYTTSGILRWHFQCDSTAETGGNAGSNFYFQSCNDSGVIIHAPMNISRNTGIVTFEQPIVNGSDIRLKSDIEPVLGALAKVEKLNGIYFKSTAPGVTKRQVGLVAQHVRDILPEVVFEGVDEDKTLGISYSNIVAVLIEAVKELSDKVKELEGGKPASPAPSHKRRR